MANDKHQNNYISLQDATKFCNYSQEYLSLRARQGKLKAVKMGRNWVTTEEWLKEYLGKVEEYNNRVNNKNLKKSATVPPPNLPVGEFVEIKVPFWKAVREGLSLYNLRPAFLMGLALVLVMAVGVFGKEDFRQVYGDVSPYLAQVFDPLVKKAGLDIFGEYAQWVSETIKESPVGQRFVKANKVIEKNLARDFQSIKENYSSANKFVEGKISKIARGVRKKYFAANDFIEEKIALGWQRIKSLAKTAWQFVFSLFERKETGLTKEELMEIEKAGREKLMEDIRGEFQKLKKEGITVSREREIIKEKEVVTRKAEIEERVVKIEEEDLKKLRERMDYLEEEIAKRLYAPGGVIQQTIRVTEPVRSPKIYQENGEIVLQTLGSGNVILSAATGLQLYGQQVVIDSTNLLNPMIYLADKTRIDGSLTAGDTTLGTLSAGTTDISGNLTVTGNLTLSGDLTVEGAQTYSGAAALTASSTEPALKVTQNGTGNIVQFLDSGTNIFTISDGGYTVLATSPSVTNPAFLFQTSDTTSFATGTATFLGINATSTFSGNFLDFQKSGTSMFYIDASGNATTSGEFYAATIRTASTDSTVRKSGEEVLREIVPIFRYDIPAQTSATTYQRVSKYFAANPLSSTPDPLPGSSRVYKLIIKFADDLPTTTSTDWRIYRTSAATTSDTFTLNGQNMTDLSDGIATTTQNLTIPDTDWQVEAKLRSPDYSLRIFQIFLAAYDKID